MQIYTRCHIVGNLPGYAVSGAVKVNCDKYDSTVRHVFNLQAFRDSFSSR